MTGLNIKRLTLSASLTLLAISGTLHFSTALPSALRQEWLLPVLLLASLALANVYLINLFAERRTKSACKVFEQKLHEQKDHAELQLRTVESLAIAIDAKDQTTPGHVVRTRVYAVELGKLLGVSPEELKALRAGALLHDIGKLAVPEYILNKPGKLTPAEFDRMKIHTTVGADIIRRIGFPYPVEELVRHHHEKWDGSGYPDGLRGEQIPLVARIISVVDFYDATRCDRPFRKGMTRSNSLSKLKDMAGTSFDPVVVEKFIANVEHFDGLIPAQELAEQVQATQEQHVSGGTQDMVANVAALRGADLSGFHSIADVQREVFALHEIAQTIGASLNLRDTLTIVSNKVHSVVGFDTCVVYLVNDRTGKAEAAYAEGVDAEAFAGRRIAAGGGITGWVLANARSLRDDHLSMELSGLPEEVSERIGVALVSPLLRDGRAFGAIALYASRSTGYTTEQVRLLEAVARHASGPVHNALVFERTKESALTDQLTGLPNERALRLVLEQRLAECQRLKLETLSILSVNIDGFRHVNEAYGHGIGDRVLASTAEIIKGQLRQMDLLARTGADGFTAVMPKASGDVAVRVAERVRAAVESQKFAARTGRTIQLGVTIGVSSFPDGGETAQDLIDAAERHMREAKRQRLAATQGIQGLVAVPLETSP